MRKIVGVLLTVVLVFHLLVPVQAANRSIGMELLEFGKDVVVKAPNSSLSLLFPVPRLAKIYSASATFSLTPGPQLNDDALFSFYLNDKLLESKTAKEIRARKKITVNLPLDGEFRDAFQLQIKSNMFISNDLCRDYNTGGLFFTVHNDTKIDLNYDMLPVRSVADFFGNFQQAALVVVPDNAGLAEMTPALWAYGILKKNYSHLDIQIVKASEVGNRPNTPRIWVAVRNQLPAYFSKTQPGIVLVDPNTLLLSGASVSELESVAKQLADLPVFSHNQMVGRKNETNAAERATAGLSFGSQSVQEGVQKVSFNYVLYPSLLGDVPEKTGMHLEGTYMVAFDQNRPPRLDVFFNNNLVHSSALDQSGKFTREIDLPEGAALLAQNNVNVQVNYPEDQGQCLISGKTHSAQVLPTSYMWGTGQQKLEQFSWSNMGMFFSRQGTVLVDEKLGVSPLKLLADLMVLLNRQLPVAAYAFPTVQSLGAQTFLPSDQYVVALLNSGNEPPFLQDILPPLPGQSPAGTQDNSPSIPADFQINANSVVGKIAENNGFPVIVFSTKQNGNLLSEALRYLNRPGQYAALVGNVMAFRQPGRVYSVNVRTDDKNAATVKPVPQGVMTRYWGQYKREILIGGAVVLGLFLLLLLMLLFNRKPKNDPPIVEEGPLEPIWDGPGRYLTPQPSMGAVAVAAGRQRLYRLTKKDRIPVQLNSLTQESAAAPTTSLLIEEVPLWEKWIQRDSLGKTSHDLEREAEAPVTAKVVDDEPLWEIWLQRDIPESVAVSSTELPKKKRAYTKRKTEKKTPAILAEAVPEKKEADIVLVIEPETQVTEIVAEAAPEKKEPDIVAVIEPEKKPLDAVAEPEKRIPYIVAVDEKAPTMNATTPKYAGKVTRRNLFVSGTR